MNYINTSWEVDGEKVNIEDVQKDLNIQNSIEIPVEDIKNMCVHLGKKDKKTLERSENSDLSYPIIIAENEDGYTMILDGHHRLLKAINHNIDKIKANVLDLTSDNIPEIFKKLFI